jgi:hypothetical protein
MRYLLVCIVCILAGCESIPVAPIVTEVKIPVQVKCLGDVPIKPKLITDAELVKLDYAQFVTALHKDRLERDIYEIQLESAIAGCL